MLIFQYTLRLSPRIMQYFVEVVGLAHILPLQATFLMVLIRDDAGVHTRHRGEVRIE